METSSERAPLVVKLGWSLTLLALAYGVVIANGAELPRLALLGPFLTVGAFLCWMGSAGGLRGGFLCLVGVASAYFLGRGFYSPVWDLARRDIFLVGNGFLAFLAAMSALRFPWGRGAFLVVLFVLVCANGVVALFQLLVEPEFAFWRRERVDVKGVSGFYYHRNYLAGFLEFVFPVFTAFAASRLSGGRRFFAILALVLCAVMGLFTNSRSGFAVMMGGGLLSYLWVRHGVRKELGVFSPLSWQKNALFVFVVMVVVVFAGWGFGQIVENRGGEDMLSNQLEDRLRMAGIALDLWMKEPVFGMGSEGYSYGFTQNFGGIGGWFGDAQMAHSDYAQVLCDYGLVGFFFILLLIVSTAWMALDRSSQHLKQEELGAVPLWLSAAALGGLGAETARSLFDFNLHLAPNLILFAMLTAGGAAICRARRNASVRTGRWNHFFGLLCVVCTGGFVIWSGRAEVVAAPTWFVWENQQTQGSEEAELLREYSEQAPSFEVLREVARQSLAERVVSEPPVESELLEQVANDWRRVVERHPLDGESLANYARSLDELEKFEDAAEYHLRAIEAVGRRENKYGVVHNVGWHFLRQATEAYQGRQSGKALFLFRQAKEAFDESYRRNFSRKEHNRSARESVNKWIQFLEEARIEPEPVEILDWQSVLP